MKRTGLKGTLSLFLVFVYVLSFSVLLTSNLFAAERPDRDYILIGHPNPSTGKVGAFGEVSPWVDDEIVAAINAEGGIYIKEYGKKMPIKVKVVDVQSSSTITADVTTKLILEDKVDMIVVMHTPDIVIPASMVCEKFNIPCIVTNCPTDAWTSAANYKWVYDIFWNYQTAAEVHTGLWKKFEGQTNKVVGAFATDDIAAKMWIAPNIKIAKEMGYKVVEALDIPGSTTDYSAIAELFKKEKAEIFIGNTVLPVFSQAWKQFNLMGYKPKFASIARAMLFPSAVETLGENADGIAVEIWWHPEFPFKSSLNGMSAKEFANAYENKAGKQWNMALGFVHAAFEVAIDSLKRAGTLDKEKINQAIRETDLDTIVGHIRFNKDQYCLTPIVGGQWTKGTKWPWELKIISNDGHPEIPLTGELMFPLPGSK
ncbi:MAG: ABC transporter substrate-binding protein [Candidatus Omnitrophota bacterium]|nr:ABC transporter substrate-binding protein [Candidatus Omnitrophota bacterium]